MWSRSASFAAVVGTYLLLLVHDVLAISKLAAVGSKFFNEEGQQFFVKGIAYQLTPKDPLVDSEQCKLDSSLMKELGANSIRVYHVDPEGDHEECMKTFADAGIYLFVDLDDFPTQIEGKSPIWSQRQFDAFKLTLDEFQKYDNTAGVFVGNEVLTTANDSIAAPYILSATRDIKAYRDSKNYRKIPVGYSAADIAELRPMLQNYLVCREDESERLDFFALNAYEWCGKSTFEVSGYSNLNDQAEGYPVPIFFSETGCNTVRPRDFEDLNAILGPEMTGTWSGAMVYEWIEELNNYGLITYGKPPEGDKSNPSALDGFSRRGTPTPIKPDFTNLKSRFASLSPTGVELSDYSRQASKITAPPCPSSTPHSWDVDPSADLPSIGQSGVGPTNPTSTRWEASGKASATPSSSRAGNRQMPILGFVSGSNPLYAVICLLVISGHNGWSM
ncbi:pH-responsive protein [Histoplasma ohiense]|nr:pH-responsive protein [Histoplasma ohiense (nom. inval.)]